MKEDGFVIIMAYGSLPQFKRPARGCTEIRRYAIVELQCKEEARHKLKDAQQGRISMTS
jgi:ribosomal protein L36